MPQTTNPNAPLHGDYRDWSPGGRYGPTGANAPVQTGTERGRNQFDYWETDAEDVNRYLETVQNDPAIIAAAKRGDAALDHELHNRGYRVPEHFKAGVDETGRLVVKPMNWWDKQKHWAIPAIGMGIAIGMGPLANAITGGGAPAGAGFVGPELAGATESLAPILSEAAPTVAESVWSAGAPTVAGAGGTAPILAGSEFVGPEVVGAGAGGAGSLPPGAGGSRSILSRLTGRNILDGAGIVSNAVDSYQDNERREEDIEIQRQRLQLDERALGQQDDQYGQTNTRSNEQFGFQQGQADRQFGANILQGNEQFGASHALRSKQFELDAPGQRLTTGVRGSMVANQSPVKAEWGGPGSGLGGQTVKFTGGHANPNLINREARALGNDVTHQALLSQLKHDDKVPYNPTAYTPGAGYTGTPYTPTERSPILDVPPPPSRRRMPSILDDDPDTAILRGR